MLPRHQPAFKHFASVATTNPIPTTNPTSTTNSLATIPLTTNPPTTNPCGGERIFSRGRGVANIIGAEINKKIQRT